MDSLYDDDCFSGRYTDNIPPACQSARHLSGILANRWVPPLFLGLEALVVGLVLNITLDMGGRNVQNRMQAFITLVAFAALLFKVNAILIVLVALAPGALLLRPRARGNPSPVSLPHDLRRTRCWFAIAVVTAVVLAGVTFAWLLHSEVGTMGLVFFKIGAVAFGTGTTIVALIQADDRGVTLALDLPSGLPKVMADRRRIAQVIGNLVINALRHTPAGGYVTLSASEAQGG
jgi:chromate transport protein ChrA